CARPNPYYYGAWFAYW
nr:immunoglobulin heavy chain junction region [Mus musculus]MBK4188837.1 immunoglobulin heavy chain junction region [Mus musculus]MBK4188838.1 immunoglobulin heavy chain junction region [Mus musculus]